MVAKERLTDFQARLDQLDELFDGEIALHTSDPCYPHAFCAVTVTRTTPEDVATPRFLIAATPAASLLSA